MTKYFMKDGRCFKIWIDVDDLSEGPRAEYDNFTSMMIWWNRYGLGDKNEFNTPREYLESLVRGNTSLTDDDIEDLSYADAWKLLEDKVVCMPIYVYEHSGITISTSAFGDPWDSGQGGWITCSKEQAEKAGHTGDDWKEKAKAMMKADIKLYDMFLQDQVYCFRIEEFADGAWEEVDCCGGYYSDNYGDALAEEILSAFGYPDTELLDEEPEELAG